MTSTTYAVLGLLCVQPWSAYELAQQMARSLRFMWPRAESGIYREPQKLIDLGYATAEEVAAGPRRTKLVYSATPAGRQAFGRWLAQPSAPPQFESEAMVKFFFCDHGTLEDAGQALAELQAHGETLLEAFRQATNHHQADSGPFPERQHIGTLTGRFVFEYATALARWAEWAQQHVDEWPDTGPGTAPMGAKVQRENARLSGTADPPVTQPGLCTATLALAIRFYRDESGALDRKTAQNWGLCGQSRTVAVPSSAGNNRRYGARSDGGRDGASTTDRGVAHLRQAPTSSPRSSLEQHDNARPPISLAISRRPG